MFYSIFLKKLRLTQYMNNNIVSDNCETRQPGNKQFNENIVKSDETELEENEIEIEKDWEINERELFKLNNKNKKTITNIIKSLSIKNEIEFNSDSELDYEDYSSDEDKLENEDKLCNEFSDNLIINQYNITNKTKSEKVEPTKSEKVEPAKSEKVEPTKSEKVEPTKSEKVEPAKSEKVEPAKSEKVEPNKSEKVEPTKSEKVEPAKSEKVELTKSEKVEQKKGRTKNEEIDYNFWEKDLNGLERLEWREYRYSVRKDTKFWKYTIKDNKFLSNSGKLNTKGTYFQKSFNDKNEIDKYINKQIKLKKL